jgi:hypothetical protein
MSFSQKLLTKNFLLIITLKPVHIKFFVTNVCYYTMEKEYLDNRILRGNPDTPIERSHKKSKTIDALVQRYSSMKLVNFVIMLFSMDMYI